MIPKPKNFTVFVAISNKERGVLEELGKAIEGIGYVISMFGADTDEWQEAKLNLEEKKGVK